MSGFYHSFVTNDPVLIKLGAGTFTKESLKNKLKKWTADDIGDEEFFQYWPDPTIDDLFGDANTGNWTASQFNKSSASSSSVSKTWDEISSLIDQFEQRADVLSIQHETKEDAATARQAAKDWMDSNINYIKHGAERCFVLNGPIFYNGTKKTDIVTKLFFNIPGAGVDHQKRVVAQKGHNTVAAVAQTATGLKYSRVKTDDARAEQHAGLYIRPDNIVDGATGDLATGKLRMSYNDSLGMWESSQTILARLLTALPAAGNISFTIPKEDSNGYLETDSDSSGFYSKSSKYYTGKFSTGLAIPVSMQDGNPHLFGPNIIIEHNAKRIEKIMVVNRSEKVFTEGTLVMCTLIGSEWIVQEFSTAGEGLPTQFGTWTFSKLIANSDAFFRDVAKSNELWTATTYENYAKERWYYEWKNSAGGTLLSFHDATDIMNMNNGSAHHKFHPSNGYFAATSFDSAKYFGRTSVDTAMAELQQDWLNGTDLKNFWGPVFPDGYNQVLAGIDNGVPAGINHEKYFPQEGYVGERSNIPADMAVNGYYSDDNQSSPILPLDYWQELLHAGGSFYQNALTYRTNIYNSQTVSQNRGLTPTNPNKLQFSPLMAELVIQSDPRAAALDAPYEQRNNIHEWMQADEYSKGDPHMFGKMFERFSTSKVGDYLPYDYFVTSAPLTKPTGTLRIYSESGGDQYEGLNLVGITAAINRFSRPGGGAINIEVFEDFGPPQFTSVTSGQAATFNGVAAFFGIASFNPGSGPQQYGFPQYGSLTDNYNSFGTTALHCRIFDAWPREDTIWDTRYFAALHFNPTAPKEGEEQSSVDFQVPTLDSGGFPSEGTDVTALSGLKKKDDWVWDTIRRGKLLSAGGFAYKKLTIGLDMDSVNIVKAGTVAETDILELPGNNVKIKVLASGGAVTGVECTYTDEFGNLMIGEDFDQGSFEETYIDPDSGSSYKGYILRYSDAVIILQGIVRYIPKIDAGPREHGGIKRLTTGTGGDSGRITGLSTSEFSLNPNDTGEYDAYFFFHNDISHTFMFEYGGSQYPGFAQYITMNIS